MKERCDNPRHPFYHRYGGRGIGYEVRWMKFENFLADMGEAPPGKTLDRRENDLAYSQTNCRWVTQKEQCRNRSSNRIMEFRGRKQSLAAWCEEMGADYDATLMRLRAGWPVDAALTTPRYQRRPKAAHV